MRVGQGDGDIFILRLQAKSYPGDSSAGPCGTGKAIDPTVHLRPDFFGRGFDMRAAVGDVIKLVRPHRIFGFFGQAARGVHEMPGVRIRRRRNKDELGTKRAQRVFLLLALRFGHDDNRLIPQRIGNERKAYPGITRRPFNNRAAGLQQPLPFGIAHNV